MSISEYFLVGLGLYIVYMFYVGLDGKNFDRAGIIVASIVGLFIILFWPLTLIVLLGICISFLVRNLVEKGII